MSKDRRKVYLDGVPFNEQFPGYEMSRRAQRDYVDALSKADVYDLYTRVYGAEPSRIYSGDIFYYMKEALKSLPMEHGPIFRWEGNKKIVSTWVPEESIILLGERKAYLNIIDKIYPEISKDAIRSAKSIFQSAGSPLSSGTLLRGLHPRGTTWDIPADMLWELASKIEDKTLGDGFKRLTKLTHEKLDNVLDLIDSDINLSDRHKEYMASVIKQIKNKPNVEYVHYAIENELQNIIDDKFFTSNPFMADEYIGGLYGVKDPESAAAIAGRKAARNPKLVVALRKEVQKIIDAGFSPAEAAHVMHSILLQRLMEDATITPPQALAIDKQISSELPHLKSDLGKKAIKKAASMGLKLSKKLPVILLAGLFYDAFINGENEEAGGMMAAIGIFKVGDLVNVNVPGGTANGLITSVGSGGYYDVLLPDGTKRPVYRDHMRVISEGGERQTARGLARGRKIDELIEQKQAITEILEDPKTSKARKLALKGVVKKIQKQLNPLLKEEGKLLAEIMKDPTAAEELFRILEGSRKASRSEGHFDMPRPKPKTAGMEFKSYKRGHEPSRAQYAQAIADAWYKGDISELHPTDVSYFKGLWEKDYHKKHTSEELLTILKNAQTSKVPRTEKQTAMLEEIQVEIELRKAQARNKAGEAPVKTYRTPGVEVGERLGPSTTATGERATTLADQANKFKTELAGYQRALARAQVKRQFATPDAVRNLDDSISVYEKRIKELKQNIRSLEQRGFIEVPGRSYTSRVSDALEKASEAAYKKGQKSIFTPDKFADLYRHAPVGWKGLAKVGASLLPFTAFDLLDLYGLLDEPSDRRMFEDIGSMIVGKEPGERRRLPITKEEIEAFEDVGGKFQVTPTEHESLMKMFMPGAMAEGQVYVPTERSGSLIQRMLYQKPSDIEEVKIQVNQEMAKKYIAYVMSRDRLDRETGEWITATGGEFQDAIERRTFTEAVKNYSEWEKGPGGPSETDLQRAEELALETALEQEVIPPKPVVPVGPWADVLMGVEPGFEASKKYDPGTWTEPKEKPIPGEKKREEPKPVKMPKPARIRKGDRPSKRTVPPSKRPSPYKKNIPLKPVDPKEEAARLMLAAEDPTLEEPTIEFIPTLEPGATRLYGLVPGFPIVGDVK